MYAQSVYLITRISANLERSLARPFDQRLNTSIIPQNRNRVLDIAAGLLGFPTSCRQKIPFNMQLHLLLTQLSLSYAILAVAKPISHRDFHLTKRAPMERTNISGVNEAIAGAEVQARTLSVASGGESTIAASRID